MAGRQFSFQTSSCEPCAAGTFKDWVGNEACEPTHPGYYQDGEGATAQKPCVPGFFSPDVGYTECVPCEAGDHAPDYATRACTECRPGAYTDVEGQASCLPCAAGSFRRFYDAPTSCLQCELSADYGLGFGSEGNGSTCFECADPQANCTGGVFQGARRGWFAEAPLTYLPEAAMDTNATPSRIYQCINKPFACLGGPDSECLDGFGGRACDFCAAGTFYNRRTKRCSSCGDGPNDYPRPQRDFFAQVVGVVALVLLIATLVALVVSKKLAIREKERASLEGQLMGAAMEMRVMDLSGGGGGGGGGGGALSGMQEQLKLLLSNFQIMGSFGATFGDVEWPT